MLRAAAFIAVKKELESEMHRYQNGGQSANPRPQTEAIEPSRAEGMPAAQTVQHLLPHRCMQQCRWICLPSAPRELASSSGFTSRSSKRHTVADWRRPIGMILDGKALGCASIPLTSLTDVAVADPSLKQHECGRSTAL